MVGREASIGPGGVGGVLADWLCTRAGAGLRPRTVASAASACCSDDEVGLGIRVRDVGCGGCGVVRGSAAARSGDIGDVERDTAARVDGRGEPSEGRDTGSCCDGETRGVAVALDVITVSARIASRSACCPADEDSWCGAVPDFCWTT